MPNTLLTASYLSNAGAVPIAGALAKLNAIPLDLALTRLWGLLPITDTITNPSGTGLSRVIQTQMTATIADAAGTANLVTGATTGALILGIGGVTMTNQGGLYACPPIVTFTGGNPSPVVNPATGLVAQPAAAQAFAQCQVRGCIVLLGGSSYTGATAVTFRGPLAPGGVQATGTVTVMAGAVTAIVMTNAGGPYLQAPDAIISDPGGGFGAEVVAGLSVLDTVVTYGGIGYRTAPTVVYTPLFKQQVPDSAGGPNQVAVLNNWMLGVIQAAMGFPFLEIVLVS